MSNIKNKTKKEFRKVRKVRKIKKTKKNFRKVRRIKKTRRGGSALGKGIANSTFSNAWASFPPSSGTATRPVLSGPLSFTPAQLKGVPKAPNPILDMFLNSQNTTRDTSIQPNSILTNTEIIGPMSYASRGSSRGIRRPSNIMITKKAYAQNIGKSSWKKFIKSKLTIPKSIPPVEKPKVPVEKPKVPVEKPKVPVEKPKVPVEKPKAPVEKPKVPVEKLKK